MQVHLFDSSAGRLVCFVTCPHQALISELISDVQVNRVALIRKCIDKLSQTVFACLCKVGAADEWISQNKMQGHGNFPWLLASTNLRGAWCPHAILSGGQSWDVLRPRKCLATWATSYRPIPVMTCHICLLEGFGWWVSDEKGQGQRPPNKAIQGAHTTPNCKDVRHGSVAKTGT